MTATVSAQQLIEQAPAAAQAALRTRLSTLVGLLGVTSEVPAAEQLAGVADAVAPSDADRLWLVAAVLGAVLPLPPEVEALSRRARLDGTAAAIADVVEAVLERAAAEKNPYLPAVEVISGRTLVDLNHTAQTSFATGIQRVALEVSRRWLRDHDVDLIGWTSDFAALRRLSTAEFASIRGELPPTAEDVVVAVEPDAQDETDAETHAETQNEADTDEETDTREASVVVPWRCVYLLPELLAEPVRAQRFQALLRFSAAAGGVIGFDCVPLMSAETTAYGMAGGFTQNLVAVSYLGRIAAISEAAALEYQGWRRMLSGAGRGGPSIAAISLPASSGTVTDETLAAARDRIGVGSMTTVLVVGSHEPRKNHLAVLHAAELLWREGLEFNLVFIGGNSWSSERFAARVTSLQVAGRPVLTMTAAGDDLLWAAYRLARCTVFPSLSEGFGLPVAESLASGTPAITSNFGSMREIAGHGGALLIDPRDDTEITDALRRLLTDDALHAELSAQARALPQRSWEDYAAETWEFLTGPDQQ